AMDPLASKGFWAGQRPFGDPTPRPHDGQVAAITRARIKPRLMTTFWRAVPPVSSRLHASPGLLLSLGIGEAPLGLQGTFSLWESAEALRDFAYRSREHRHAIARTRETGWYSEDLFARFAVTSVRGSFAGQGYAAIR
ncbi:MAG: monooxygenase, partial [Candidatus Nanopelagicales bacterium]